MGPGQHDVRRHRADRDRLVLDVGNVVVGWPVVRHQSGVGGDGAEHESVDLALAEALDHLKSGAARGAAVDFDRAGDQHLADSRGWPPIRSRSGRTMAARSLWRIWNAD